MSTLLVTILERASKFLLRTYSSECNAYIKVGLPQLRSCIGVGHEAGLGSDGSYKMTMSVLPTSVAVLRTPPASSSS